MTQSERPGPMTIRDPKIMRALAHPARLAILDHLTHGNEAKATATECAEVVGLSPSATSYHLRALARAGLVQEASGRGDGRERVWRASTSGFQVETDDSESMPAAIALMEAVLERDDALAREFFRGAPQERKDWYDAAVLRRERLVMTAAELTDLMAAVAELLHPYARAGRPVPPPDARPVSVLVRAFPLPEARP